MAAPVTLRTRAYRWMGQFKTNHPIAAKAIRAAVPVVSGGLGAAADILMSYGVPRESLAVSVPAAVAIGESIRSRISLRIRIEELKGAGEGADVKQIKKQLQSSQEYNEFLTNELEAMKEKVGAAEGAGIRYETVEELGRGAQAIVLLVKDRAVNQPRVLKVPALGDAIRYYRGNLKMFLSRFKAEAANLSKLEHPNIVKIYHFDEMDLKTYVQITGEDINPQEVDGIEKFPFILMEYVKGENLGSKLAEESRKGYSGFPLSFAADIIRSLVDALEEMKNKSVIHRDFKTENIVLTSSGPKLIDFGIARGVEGAGTVLGSAMGSPGYMSPEQMGAEVEAYMERKLGHKVQVSWKSDLYGLGATLWELITGKPPYEGLEKFTDVLTLPLPSIERNLHERSDRLVMDLDRLLESIDPMGERDDIRQFKMDLQVAQSEVLGGINRIIKKTMNHDPAKRYNELREFQKDLSQVIAANERYQHGLDRFLKLGSMAYSATAVIKQP